MATRKTFLYFEVEVSQSLRDLHNEYDHVGYVINQVLDTMIEETNSKHAKTLKEMITTCTAHFAYKDDTNTGALCIEFLTKRDYDKREALYSGGITEYFSNAGIEYSNEVVRHIDIIGMQIIGENDEPDSYWKTKVYFNDTLPKSRGFSTDCMLDEADEGVSWINHWTREL